MFQAPIAVVSFVDRERQWFKSHFGLNISETPRDTSFCTHTILSDQVMVVADAAKDERFRKGAIVVGNCKIRFYAGAPLINTTKPQGHGTRLGEDRRRGTPGDGKRLWTASQSGGSQRRRLKQGRIPRL